MSRAAYNEIDPKAAAWLRELIKQGLIAPGDVIEASIEDLTPNDLKPYTQVHFFAGIGVWSYALRAAGWADDRPVWTGSCPCQPFSAAGKGGGFDDERHLWPAFHYLIDQCRPDVVFGEQVASKDGLGWLDLVQADLEGTGYASGAVDLCAAGVGAPHIRQRLWWFGERLADANGSDPQQPAREGAGPAFAEGGWPSNRAAGRGDTGWLADGDSGFSGQRRAIGRGSVDRGDAVKRAGFGSSGELEWMADTNDARPQGRRACVRQFARHAEASGETRPDSGRGAFGGLANDRSESGQFERTQQRGDATQSEQQAPCGEHTGRRSASDLRNYRPGPTNGLWSDADWLHCRDGKWRPVEPGTFPLAHGAPERVGRLRGYGNAIVAPAAQAFVEAYLEAEADGGLSVNSTSLLSHETGVFA